jgi:hypothetical protein
MHAQQTLSANNNRSCTTALLMSCSSAEKTLTVQKSSVILQDSICHVQHARPMSTRTRARTIDRLKTPFYIIYYYEYRHKLAFQNIMRAGDKKLMINLEWP